MESDAVESRNWLELPPEVTSIILQKIGVIDLLNNAREVCTSWHAICHDPSMWRSIHLKFDPSCNFSVDVEKLATYAVDMSRGQLVDITVPYFATDDFIHHLANSSPKLRRLQILYCHRLSDDVFKETASKFPMLEELKVQSTPLSVAAVEAIGSFCPQLKIFKCNSLGYAPYQAQDDELANTIARAMPHLCHLQLLRTKITNVGLKAILKGCPRLETLDIRGCNHVELKVDNLGAVCAAQLKKVRFPSEPIEPNEIEDVEESPWYSDYDDDSYSDFEFAGHFDDPSDIDEMFDYDYDYDDIFDYEDNELGDYVLEEVDNEEEGEHEEDLELEVDLERLMTRMGEEAAARMEELESNMRIIEEEEEELESEINDYELEEEDDEEYELEEESDFDDDQ